MINGVLSFHCTRSTIRANSRVQSPCRDVKVCKESPLSGLDLFPFTVKRKEKDTFFENYLSVTV